MRALRDVFVTVRDGVRIAVDVFLPDEESRSPALLAMSPYGKGLQTLPIPPQPAGAPSYMPPIEAGDPAYLTARGYVLVIADVRGVGKSDGEYLGWVSPQEARDGYDLIEWMSGQEWCTGDVGMVGISYYGTIQLMVAALQPPHLRAIMPWNAPADFYREATHHGGIRQSFFHYLYVQRIGAERSTSVTVRSASPQELDEIRDELKRDPDLRVLPELYSIADSPGKAPCYFDVLAHPTDGPFYWERSPYTVYDQIRVPSYIRSGWWAYGHMHLVGAFRNYLGIDAPRKLEIDGPVVEERPLPDDFNETVVRWYDYWLKGIDTGIMDGLPIRLFTMGVDEWRSEQEWPLARTQWTPYYFRRWGVLSESLEPTPGKPDAFVQQPVDETAAVSSVQYTTDPLRCDLDVTGPISLTLYASIDQSDTNWIVALRDVFPDGREVELSRGFLKASHRALDQSRSTTHEPYHPHIAPEAVPLGEVVLYAISLAPTSNVFRAGHRIKLVIASMDHSAARDWSLAPATIGRSHLPWHVGSSETTVHKIYHDREHPSHVLLPVIPSGA